MMQMPKSKKLQFWTMLFTAMCGTACTLDIDEGLGTLLGLGGVCTLGSECVSGYCVDGVCCDSNCTGTCQACTLALKGSGTDGTCGTIAPNTDPQNECASGDCNGSGACEAPSGASPNGDACASGNTCLSGYCIDGVCCDLACTGLCQACSAAKKGSGVNGTCGTIDAGLDPDNECPDSHCNGAGACVSAILLGNGNSCSSNDQCASGACADGYCCESACTEACKSCNVSGSIGTCKETTPGSCSVSTCTGTIGLPWEPVIPIGNYPQNMVLGDFDGNGLVDLAIALGVGSASVMLAQGNGVFATSNYPVTAAPTCIVTEDFNGDMLPDLALGNCPGKTGNAAAFVSVLLNNGNGTFAAAVTSSLVVWTMDMVAGDLNGDNKADLVVAQNSGISVYFGTGTGSFGASVNYDVGGSSRKTVAMADMDANGSNDLLITVNTGNKVSVFLNQGAGIFGPAVDYFTSTEPRRTVVADWNGDGIRDLAVVTVQSPIVNLFFNTGNGILGPKIDVAIDRPGFDIITSDINGDSWSDLIVNLYPVGVNILLNQGGGTFASSVGYESTETVAVGAADFNGDNQRDLALLHKTWNDISMMYNQGNGTFPLRNTLNIDSFATSAVTADFDHNGLPDVLINNGTSESMSLLLNQGNATFAPTVEYPFPGIYQFVAADLNGDSFHDVVAICGSNISVRMNQGNGTFAAPIEYPQSPAGIYYIAAADVNGDGKIDVVTSVNSTNVGVLLNTGNGTLAPRVDYVVADPGTSLINLAMGDLNGDGQSDIVAAVSFGNLRVLLSQGNGAFGAPMTYPVGSSFLQQLAVDDFGGDGLPDVVAADLYDSVFAVFHNLGNGILMKDSTYSLEQRPRGLAVADVDRDGIKDLLFASGSIDKSRIRLYRGLGSNNFIDAGRYETRPGADHGIVAADFDGDNATDFAVIASGAPGGVKLDIMLNRCLQ